MNHNTWILVADAYSARIYSAVKATLLSGNASKLKLISEHKHEDSRKREHELVSDRQGSFGRGNFSEHTDPKKYEEDTFALELAKILQKAQVENQFNDLIFIAPPSFMGMVKKHLSHELAKKVSLTIERDYTKMNERDLAEHMIQFL